MLGDEHGNFALPDVQPGRYTVAIYFADLSLLRVVDVRGATVVDQTIDDASPGTGKLLTCTSARFDSCR